MNLTVLCLTGISPKFGIMSLIWMFREANSVSQSEVMSRLLHPGGLLRDGVMNSAECTPTKTMMLRLTYWPDTMSESGYCCTSPFLLREHRSRFSSRRLRSRHLEFSIHMRSFVFALVLALGKGC